jgi:hypothetical protein
MTFPATKESPKKFLLKISQMSHLCKTLEKRKALKDFLGGGNSRNVSVTPPLRPELDLESSDPPVFIYCPLSPAQG